MEKKTEFALALKSTGKVLPKVFKTETAAEEFCKRSICPDSWKIVQREVVYGDWK